MKLRVISDGTPRGFRVTNAETGEPVTGIHEARFIMESGELPLVQLTFLADSFEGIGSLCLPGPAAPPLPATPS